MPDGSLQAALPREMYVDPGTWLAEREVALFGQWFCLGRTDDLGLEATARVATVDVAGESVLVMRAEDGALHAAYNVCRHRGSQIRPTVASAETSWPATCRPCAARTTRGPTASTAGCCAHRTPS
jgi:Rieske 2Fe-2S family protein